MKRNTHIEMVIVGNEVHFHELPNRPSWEPRLVFTHPAKFDKYHKKNRKRK